MSAPSSHLVAIPFLLVPIVSLTIALLARSRRPQGVRVFFAISSLGILSIITGALALASFSSFGLVVALAVFTSLLKFELGVSIIYLFTLPIPYHIGLRLYNTLIAFILSSATLTSVVYPFAPHSFPPLVPPILTLAFALLSLPLLVFQRRLLRSTIPLPLPPPRSPTSKREKGAYVFADEPLMVNLCLARGGDPEFQINNTRPKAMAPKATLFCAQFSIALSSAFGIGSVLSGGIFDKKPSRVALVFDILQSVFFALGIVSIMFAFLFSSSRTRDTPSPVATPFTPPPTRSSRSPQMRSYYPPRNPPNHHPPTPTPSQLSEDFRNLSDPFASPNSGVALGENGRPCSDVTLGREFPSIGRVISGHVGSSTVHTTADAPSCLHTHHRAYRSAKPKALSVPVLNLPKPKRHHRRTKKGSPQGLIVSTHPPPSFPFPTHTKCHDRVVHRPKFSATASTSSSAEDIEFDPQEAILSQLLLRSLDSESQAGSGTGECEGEGESDILELADLLPPPATHRFTHDSTSTGVTLCDSEVFRLGRGSVSTAFSSPPASPGGEKDVNRSDGG